MASKRKYKGKLVATILGLSILVGGLGAGLVLVQQSQTVTPFAYELEIPAQPVSGTCSAGMSKCVTSVSGVENATIEVCVGAGLWKPSIYCGRDKCEIANGVARCKPVSNYGCKVGDTQIVACTTPGYSKLGTCTSAAGYGYWKYASCVKNSSRIKCEVRNVTGGFQWRDPTLKDNKWSSTVKGVHCENVWYDKRACIDSDNGDSGYLLCQYVPGAEEVCSNVGFFDTINNECISNADLKYQFEPGLYGPKSQNDFLPQLSNIKCLRNADCTNATGLMHLICEGSDYSPFGRCVSDDADAFCRRITKEGTCDTYEGVIGNMKVQCTWNGIYCAVNYIIKH